MQLRSISIIAVLFVSLSLIFTPNPVLATDKEDVRSTVVSFEGKLPGELNTKMLADHLANGIAVQTDAERIRLHVVAVREGRAVKTHSSETIFLRRRPGRTKIIGTGPLPPVDFFEGFALKDFITPKRGISFPGEYTPGKMAEVAFESVGQTDGVFVVATFDDMIKGDMTRGLVGFGSWN